MYVVLSCVGRGSTAGCWCQAGPSGPVEPSWPLLFRPHRLISMQHPTRASVPADAAFVPLRQTCKLALFCFLFFLPHRLHALIVSSHVSPCICISLTQNSLNVSVGGLLPICGGARPPPWTLRLKVKLACFRFISSLSFGSFSFV